MNRDNSEGLVQFKSVPRMWEKEWISKKCNTVQEIDEDDIRFKKLRNGCPLIKLVNTKSKSFFTREITDYTEWKGMAIISWGAFNWLDKKGNTNLLEVKDE